MVYAPPLGFVLQMNGGRIDLLPLLVLLMYSFVEISGECKDVYTYRHVPICLVLWHVV